MNNQWSFQQTHSASVYPCQRNIFEIIFNLKIGNKILEKLFHCCPIHFRTRSPVEYLNTWLWIVLDEYPPIVNHTLNDLKTYLNQEFWISPLKIMKLSKRTWYRQSEEKQLLPSISESIRHFHLCQWMISFSYSASSIWRKVQYPIVICKSTRL